VEKNLRVVDDLRRNLAVWQRGAKLKMKKSETWRI
jgi:hypothetical protein